MAPPRKVEVQEKQIGELISNCEHFLEANRVALEVLSTLIPKVQDVTQRCRLGVLEDILEGACTRYSGG